MIHLLKGLALDVAKCVLCAVRKKRNNVRSKNRCLECLKDCLSAFPGVSENLLLAYLSWAAALNSSKNKKVVFLAVKDAFLPSYPGKNLTFNDQFLLALFTADLYLFLTIDPTSL